MGSRLFYDDDSGTLLNAFKYADTIKWRAGFQILGNKGASVSVQSSKPLQDWTYTVMEQVHSGAIVLSTLSAAALALFATTF